MTFGGFIQPDEQAQDQTKLAEHFGITIYSGYKSVSQSRKHAGQNRIYDRVADRLAALDLGYEDQCSAKYYYDLVRTLRDLNGQFDRVVEVGVFMGGSTSYLAGCMQPFDFDLDLVDVSADFLRFSYERVRRMYPEAATRIRLFHGDLPSYVRHEMLANTTSRYIVHHDGAHDFNQVVKDMASLSFVKDKIEAIIAQDTHLRGTIDHMNFVDMALFAVFGMDLKFATIGEAYPEGPMTQPNAYQGNYFLPGAAEGVVLPMAANTFQYPHPMLLMDDFLPPALEHTSASAA